MLKHKRRFKQVQVDSDQQNALLLRPQELETSQNNYAIQGAKLKTHITELAETKGCFQKSFQGKSRSNSVFYQNQRTLFQEQTEHTRKLMNDYKGLKEEFELLKERHERKESPKGG